MTDKELAKFVTEQLKRSLEIKRLMFYASERLNREMGINLFHYLTQEQLDRMVIIMKENDEAAKIAEDELKKRKWDKYA